MKRLCFVLLVGVFVYLIVYSICAKSQMFVESYPRAIMGTSCHVVVYGEQEALLGGVEKCIRQYELELSTWIERSALSRVNSATADERVSVPASVVTVLNMAKSFFSETGQVFDVTCTPVFQLWAQAVDETPSMKVLEQARKQSDWGMFEIADKIITKNKKSACLEVGGIAKGWVIDQAVSYLEENGAEAGLVDIGGDLRLFGQSDTEEKWPVQIMNARGDEVFATIYLDACAVCTSGNYFRYSMINEKKYSHIIDPRTLLPADVVPSVTIIGKEAVCADVWATALSILGEGGFALLPQGYEALLLFEDGSSKKTKGFPSLDYN